MLLRVATRQTGREDQGHHEAHERSCNESVSVSYLLSVVMLCPNLVGMESPMSTTSTGATKSCNGSRLLVASAGRGFGSCSVVANAGRCGMWRHLRRSYGRCGFPESFTGAAGVKEQGRAPRSLSPFGYALAPELW